MKPVMDYTLYLVTDEALCSAPTLEEGVEQALKGGATLVQLREKAPWVKVMVGGAVLTQEYADTMGADQYCRDAMASVNYAEQVFA